MRVCVTGGTGFIGRALVRRLLAEGAQVRVLARPSPRADALAAQGAEVVRGDLSDVAAIERAVAAADVVQHTAAKVGLAATREDFFEANVRGTERILKASLAAGVGRVVYLSSIAVYGLAGDGERITEETPFDNMPEKRDLYAQTKIAADELASSFAAKTALPTSILRPGLIYGPTRPLPAGILAFHVGKTDFVFGTTDQRIPLNYIENLVDAMQQAATEKGAKLRQYIVLDDDNLTLGQYHAAKKEIAGTGAVFLPSWPVLLGAPLGGIPKRQVIRALQNRFYDTTRIRQELGWTPKVPLREAIRRTLAKPE